MHENFFWRFKKARIKTNKLWKKEMIPLTNEENRSYHNQNTWYLCKKEFCTDDNDKYYKVRFHCHYTGKNRGAAHNIWKLRHKIPKKIPLVFHNCSKYESHFRITELAEEFKGQFECLEENTE